MTRLTVTGLGVFLADGGDRHTLHRKLYAGDALKPLAASERDRGLRSAAARALRDADIERREDFIWIHAGDLQSAFGELPGVDLKVGTLFDALESARKPISRRKSGAVLITGAGPEECGAVVLSGLTEGAGPRIYAVVEGFARWDAGRAEVATAGCRRALREADRTPEDVGYVAYLGTGLASAELPEVGGLLEAYRTPDPSLSCGLGALPDSAGGVLGMIKAITALAYRFIPGLVDGSGPDSPARWDGTPFYVETRSRSWFLDSKRVGRVAAVHGQGGHLILSESGDRLDTQPMIARTDYVLVPIAFEDRLALERALDALQSEIEQVDSVKRLRGAARRAYERYLTHADAPHAIALVGEGRAGMLREIDYAWEGLAKVFEEGGVWRSPRGSTLTMEPLGSRGVAFVYPGAFNAYLDLGRDLLQLFPFLYERFGDLVSDVGRSIRERALYPRSLTPLTRTQRRAREASLLADPPALIEAGASFGVLYTAILREAFGVHPRAALGYSLGEVSMLWALGVWQDADQGLQMWRSSPLFQTQLSGRKALIRERWGIPSSMGDDEIWATFVLKAPVQQVRAAVADRPRVEITLINTPGEVVIGGDPTACRAVIEQLDIHALPVPYDAVIHSSLMASLRPAFAELYRHPVHAAPETTFYSAAAYEPLTIRSADLADSLAQMTCAPVDFTRLVDRVYGDGASLFVEVGPQRTCTRWIDKILRDRPHAAVAVDRKGQSDAPSILGVLAALVSHRVPLDLSLLYEETPSQDRALSRALEPAVADVSDGAAAAPHDPLEVRSTAARTPLEDAGRVLERTAMHVTHEHMIRDAALHRSFLDVRQRGMEDFGALIQSQMAICGEWLGEGGGIGRPQFDEHALRAFAQGSPTVCFGSLFAPFEGRRVPRIPNGDFRLISRVLEVDGPKGEVTVGRTLTSEYDVPANGWFLGKGGTVPYAILMEMGMQPCGFLSAYMGSTRRHPEVDFYFRNLDGQGALIRQVDLRGRTLTARVRLQASTAGGNAVIQTFEFALACGGRDFYRGEATFGYFTRATLNARAGLDGGEAVLPWLQRVQHDVETFAAPPVADLPPRLAFLERTSGVLEGGTYGRGYLYATLDVPSDAWFFRRHFYEDPVMPGSLGVASMREALGRLVYARLSDPQNFLPVMMTPTGRETRWRYRGQIEPADLRGTGNPGEAPPICLEVHLQEMRKDADGVQAWGDGSLWRDGLRIYEVHDLGIAFSVL